MSTSLQILFSNDSISHEAVCALDLLHDDSPAIIEKVNNFIKNYGIPNCQGFLGFNNLLFKGVMHGNVTLVEYIIANVDLPTLGMRDVGGENALFKCTHCVSVDKTVSIAKALISANIDINSRRCAEGTTILCSTAPLDYTQLNGNSVLGHCLKHLNRSLELSGQTVSSSIAKLYRLAQYLKAQGAECYISGLGTISDTVPVQVDDNVQKNAERTQYHNLLSSAQVKVIESYWKQQRHLYIAMKDPQSLLFGLPTDIVKLITCKVTEIA